MSEMKQGPWTVVEHSWAETSVMEKGERVCLIDISPYVEDEVEQDKWMDKATARARLIAAAPDLLEGLKALYKAYVNTLEAGRDRIISLGGTCDPVDRMEQDDHALLRARQLIAKAQGHAHD